MGMGNAGTGSKAVIWIVGAVLLVGALVGLIILSVVLS